MAPGWLPDHTQRPSARRLLHSAETRRTSLPNPAPGHPRPVEEDDRGDMVTEEELRERVDLAQRRMDEVVAELREVAAATEALALLASWRSAAAERFRTTSRELAVALYAAAFRCEAESRALPALAATTMFPVA
jgi:hypothetical protein